MLHDEKRITMVKELFNRYIWLRERMATVTKKMNQLYMPEAE